MNESVCNVVAASMLQNSDNKFMSQYFVCFVLQRLLILIASYLCNQVHGFNTKTSRLSTLVDHGPIAISASSL